MIDHVSIAVRDLEAAAHFYAPLLATLGFSRLRDGPDTVGFGKRYPEFWLNRRHSMQAESGLHICLRARTRAAVDAFHATALAGGGTSDGAPGMRPEYSPNYYAAFIRDLDGNRIEAVTFLETNPGQDR